MSTQVRLVQPGWSGRDRAGTVLFQSITHMAPAPGRVLDHLRHYLRGRGDSACRRARPCRVPEWWPSASAAARHLPSAGGLYTYNARGLIRRSATSWPWVSMMAEPLVAPLLYLIFGNVLSVYLNSHFNTPTWLWRRSPRLRASSSGPCYRGIRISTEAGVALGALRSSFFLRCHHAHHRRRVEQTHSPFSAPARVTRVDWARSSREWSTRARVHRLRGRGAYLARKPEPSPDHPASRHLVVRADRSLLPRVLLRSDRLFRAEPDGGSEDGFFGFNGGDPWDGLAAKVWGPFSILVPARDHQQRDRKLQRGCQRGNEDGLRAGFGGHLPRALAAVHPLSRRLTWPSTSRGARYRDSVVLGFVLSSPLNAFALLATMVTLIVVVIYILTNLSNLVFYWRETPRPS